MQCGRDLIIRIHRIDHRIIHRNIHRVIHRVIYRVIIMLSIALFFACIMSVCSFAFLARPSSHKLHAVRLHRNAEDLLSAGILEEYDKVLMVGGHLE